MRALRVRAALAACAALAAAAVVDAPAGGGSAAAAGAGAGAAGARATWVWDADTALSPERRERLLGFARAWSVDTLFVQESPRFERGDGADAFASLVQAAAAQATAVVLVGGDPAWALPAHRGDALAAIERAVRINARLEARKLPRVRRVLFDVEPYLLSEWRRDAGAVVGDYVALLDAIRRASRAAGLEAWQTIPFWFARRDFAGGPLDRAVLERSDGVVVMAYRRDPAAVASAATPVLSDAADLAKPVVVAVETTCVEPTYVTFCGVSAAVLNGALARLEATLGRLSSFSGLAVHQFASWRTLEEAAP
ncbi:MAG TPA: hypothetical protein VE987_11650 [Polyangiaceae bacterium]|nr:hypothetical protein [Polyangiaceae bacterium]